MKATIEYNLPEDEMDMKYAMAGLDALLLIEDVINEIRSYLKHGAGEFKEWNADVYNEETDQFEKKKMKGCDETLEKVIQYICELKEAKKLPELI
jgi:hypothetical protein